MPRFKVLNDIKNNDPKTLIRKYWNSFKYYLSGLWHSIDEHHLFLAGGGIAFSLMLSIVPIILLTIAILGNVLEPSTIELQISKAIDTIIPYPKYAEYTKETILKRIPDVIEYKTLSGYLGGIGLFFTSTWLFSSLRTVLNNVFGIPKSKSALHALGRDFAMVIMLIIFVLVSTFLLPLLNFLINAAESIELLSSFRLSDLNDLILSAVSIVIMFIMFFIFYKVIPYAKLGKRVPLVSAFWATLLWELARNIFGYYVANFLSTGRVYGAFILIIVVLFWLFYSSCLFIVAAEIGQLYRERLKRDSSKN